MQLYTESTDGSYIEHKESAIVWHHQEADPDFGSCQAKELLDHLESVLANEPVVVKRGQYIVEVNPQVSACKLLPGCSDLINPSDARSRSNGRKILLLNSTCRRLVQKHVEHLLVNNQT